MSTLPAGTRWSILQPSSSFTCGLTTVGMVYCWGQEFGGGELGTGVALTDLQESPVPVDVSAIPGFGVGVGDSDTESLSVTVPQPGPGEFAWAINGTEHAVQLTDAENRGAYLQSTGSLVPVTVTDTRTGGSSWSVSGQVSDFTGGLPGKDLGWTPGILTPGGGATAGDPVASGFDGGNGLSDSSILASATAGHPIGGASAGADLDLRIPIDTPAGSYSAVLTLTALS